MKLPSRSHWFPNRVSLALAGGAVLCALAAAVLVYPLGRMPSALAAGAGALALYLAFVLHRFGRTALSWRRLLPVPLLAALVLAHFSVLELHAGHFERGALLAGGTLLLCLFFAGRGTRPLRRPVRRWILPTSLALLGFAAWAALTHWQGQPLFWGAFLLLYLGFIYNFDQMRGSHLIEPAPLHMPRRLENSLIILVFLLALGLRIGSLDRYPAGLYIDESYSGQMAAEIADKSLTLDHPEWPPIFIPWGGGRCGFSYWFTAAWIKALGPTELALRLDALIFAMLTIPAFYFLMRQVADPWSAILASVLLAADRWHLTFSPLAWGTPPMLFFGCLGFGAVLHGLRHDRTLALFLGGAAVGLSVNTYASARFIAVVFALILILYLLWSARARFGKWRTLPGDALALLAALPVAGIVSWFLTMAASRQFFPPWKIGPGGLLTFGLLYTLLLLLPRGFTAAHRPLRQVLFAALGFYLAMLPLAHYALAHPRTFNARIAEVRVWGPQTERGIPTETLQKALAASEHPELTKLRMFSGPVSKQARRVALMFHYEGDARARHNLPGAPAFNHVEGMLLLFGLAVLLARLGTLPALVLLPWFLVPVCGTVFFDFAPHMLRSLPALPAAVAIAGVGIAVLWSTARREWGRWGAVPLGLALAGIVAWGAYDSAHRFYTRQTTNNEVVGGFSPSEVATAEYMRYYMDDHPTVPAHTVVATPYPYNTAAIKFLTMDRYKELELWNSGKLPFVGDGTKPILFFIETAFENVLPLIRHYFPNGTLVEVDDRVGQPVGKAYHVPAEEYTSRLGFLAEPLSARDEVAGGTAILMPEEAPGWTRAPRLRLSAMLHVKDQGDYAFRVLGGASVEIRINMGPVAPEHNVALIPGAQQLVLVMPAGNPDLRPVLQWRKPGEGHFSTISREELFAARPEGGGLLARIYLGDSWSGSPIIQRRETFIQAPFLPVCPYSVEWTGYVNIPVGGSIGFQVCSDDASFLWIDDELWLENGGQHGRECKQSIRQLSAGKHKIKLRYNQVGGAQSMELWWMLPQKPWEMVPSDAYSPE